MKIYLACPYSDPDPSVRDSRVLAVDMAAASLMEQGHIVFSPLSHSHPISRFCKVDPTDHDFWLRQDLAWLRHCDELWVLTIDGWEGSKGIKTEIEEAKRMGIPARYFKTIEKEDRL